MKLLFQFAICVGLSIIFQKLLFAYWTQKEGPNSNHEADAWVFGVIAGVIMGILVIEGIESLME